MNFDIALNTYIGSFLVITLVFADCASKYSADHVQKNTFCTLLIVTNIALLADLFFSLLSGISGSHIRFLLYGISFIYYIFQVLTYYYLIVFLDYMVFKDRERVKKISLMAYAVTIIHLIILLINFKFSFYFSISEIDNDFVRGDKYIIRLIIGYLALPFIIYELAMSYTKLKNKSYFSAILIFIILTVFGSLVDVFTDNLSLIWPCISAALLYFYFFIIQTDTRIDGLTGIGNRYSFGEFTEWLSHRSVKEVWAIFLIDMDHFKAINDTLGHQEGDNALKDMANIIKKCITGSDFAARYGGDEFVLATKAEGNNTKLIDKIQEDITKLNEKNIRPYKLEISYGYDIYTTGGFNMSIDEFLNHIDTLMYKNKEERRRRSSDKNMGAS